MAEIQPALFRQVLDFARSRYEEDRKSYHVSANLEKVPEAAMLSSNELPDLLNQFDARQVLHVTYGSVLDTFNDALTAMLQQHEAAYHAAIRRHFDRHLEPFQKG
jgi:hypothetical protein